jgi:thiamine biosynthesis lipoprotein
MDGVTLDPAARTVRFRRPGMELNLGSIGKGYALGKAATTLRSRGVERALLSAGGSSVLALGGGRAGWVIDLRSRRVSERLARLRLWDGALATSGGGEQFVEVDGTRYGHVLDPRTGRPASGVVSVSVVAADPAVADALATAFLVGGIDSARRYCATHIDTLALITLEGDERPRRVGGYRGAGVEEDGE